MPLLSQQYVVTAAFITLQQHIGVLTVLAGRAENAAGVGELVVWWGRLFTMGEFAGLRPGLAMGLIPLACRPGSKRMNGV